MASRKRKKTWSYHAGEKGRNRVRAYEDEKSGLLLLEFYERDFGTALTKRKRVSLKTRDQKLAKQKADELAARLANEEQPRAQAITLRTLFDIYVSEKTPEKSPEKQQHDRTCAEMFLRYFGAARLPETLSVRDGEQFIRDRREGKIAPAGVGSRRKVSDRAVGYDLGFLLAVLRWATFAGDGRGATLLSRNPLQGLSRPRNKNPRRPVLTEDQYAALRAVAPQIGPLFDLVLVLAHETGHRVGAIRSLRWSDMDLEGRTVFWRAETDKLRRDHRTPLTEEAFGALLAERARRPGIGDAWVFPSPGNPDVQCSRHLLRDWWKVGAKLAALPVGQRLGYHSFRRKFATDLKDAPVKVVSDLGGWKDPYTVLAIYQQPDEAAQREVLSNRGHKRAAAGI